MADSRLGEKEYKRWQDRLQHAHKVWIEKGLVGNQMSTMRMLLEMYRGNQWGVVKGFLGLDEAELVTVNKIYSGANTLQAQIAARDPEVQVFPIWDCLLDPLAPSWNNDGELKWVAFRSLMTEEQIRNTPGMVWKKGLSPNVSQHYKDMRSSDLLDDQNEDWGDLYEIWSVYEIRERTWFQMTMDGAVKGPLRDQDEWPLEWEHLPIDIFAVNEQMDSPFPIPMMEEAIPIQLELNRLRTIMSIVARNTRRLVGITKGGMDDDELDKLEDSAVVELLMLHGPAKEVMAEIRAGGFPQELIPYNELLERDFRELTGQSQMDRAQRINVETAQEASQVQMGSDIHTIRNQQAFEKFITSSVRNYMHGRRQTTSEEELIPVVGPGAEPFVSVVANVQKPYEDYFVARGKNPREYVKQQGQAPPQQPGQQPPAGGKIDPAAFSVLQGGGQR